MKHTNEGGHTPTPWEIDTETNQRIMKGRKVVCHLIDDMDTLRCLMNEADLAFIVKAVNSHEDSVKAMKLAFNLIVFGHTHKRSEAIEALDMAIAKAEGKS